MSVELKKTFFIPLFLCLCLASIGIAGDQVANPFPGLHNSIGATSLAMGGTGVVSVSGMEAILWNPASIFNDTTYLHHRTNSPETASTSGTTTNQDETTESRNRIPHWSIIACGDMTSKMNNNTLPQSWHGFVGVGYELKKIKFALSFYNNQINNLDIIDVLPTGDPDIKDQNAYAGDMAIIVSFAWQKIPYMDDFLKVGFNLFSFQRKIIGLRAPFTKNYGFDVGAVLKMKKIKYGYKFSYLNGVNWDNGWIDDPWYSFDIGVSYQFNRLGISTPFLTIRQESEIRTLFSAGIKSSSISLLNSDVSFLVGIHGNVSESFGNNMWEIVNPSISCGIAIRNKYGVLTLAYQQSYVEWGKRPIHTTYEWNGGM